MIATNRIKSKVKNHERLTNFDFKFVSITESYIHLILFADIFDFALYGCHQILHQNLSKEYSTSFHKVSYAFALLLVFLVICEVIGFYLTLKNLDCQFLVSFEKIYAQIEQSIRKEDIREKLKNRYKEKIQIYEDKKKYKMGVCALFFTQGIKPKKLNQFLAKWLRFMILVKMIFFEVMIVSLQNLPKFNICLMLTIELIVVTAIFHSIFISRIYNDWITALTDFLIELNLALFFLLATMIEFSKGEQKQKIQKFQKFQIFLTYLILLTTVINMFAVICSLVKTGIMTMRKRKLRKKSLSSVKPKKIVKTSLKTRRNKNRTRTADSEGGRKLKNKSGRILKEKKEKRKKGNKVTGKRNVVKDGGFLKKWMRKQKRREKRKKESFVFDGGHQKGFE